MVVERKFSWHSSVMAIIGAVAGCSLSSWSNAAQAAQTIVVRRGSFTDTIQLADLKIVAETGSVPRNLENLARILTPQQRSQVEAALQAKFKIDPVAASNVLNSEYGNNLAIALASTTSKADRLSVQAVKTGLILGARNPEGLSLLSFIEAYPRPRLEIDLDRAFRVVGNFNAAFWQTQAFMAAIAPQLAPRRPTITLPFDPTQPGSAEVQVLKLTLNDQERRRDIPVDLYWSSVASPDKPVIVFSHGLGSVRTDMRYLAEHLASYGYVVAALEHPGSNETHIRKALQLKAPLLQAEEFLNRPQDISFVLDQLNILNQTSEPLQGKLATDRAMVVGYSLGGTTALSIAGAELQLERLRERCPGNILALSLGETAQCFAKDLPENRYQLRDPRVKAAIALSPITSLLFGETGLSQVAVPTLMLASSADKTAPALTEQIVGFEQIPQPKWLVGIVGGTHLSVKDPSTTIDQAGQPDTLYTGGEIVGEAVVDVHNYVKAITLAMAAQLTDDADQYTLFLTPDYAQYASTQAFPLRLIREIPPDGEAIIQNFVQSQPRS